MSDLQTFGVSISGYDVGQAVVSTMQLWIPAYCGWKSRQIGQSSTWLPVPQSYVITDDEDHRPEDEPPAVVVCVPGTSDVDQQGNRTYMARWPVCVSVFVTSIDMDYTFRLVNYYAAIVRQLLIQKADLGSFAAGTKWRGERYDRRAHDASKRTLGCADVMFHVDVRQVAHAFGGPATPPPDPTQIPLDNPTAVNVTVSLQGN